MKKHLTVLISSAGRRNQLLDCFRQDAALLGIDLRILAADVQPKLSPACHQADASFAVPPCAEEDFVPAMLELCRQQDVSLLVPTIDPELAALSANAARFETLGTRVVVSAPGVVALAHDKLTTAARLAAAEIGTTRSLSLAAYRRDPAQLRWPVIAKPNAGSASMGIVFPRDPQELSRINPEGYIVQEFWPGREYTVNLFFDRAGRLCCAVPHERVQVRAGEVSKGVTRHLPALEQAAQKLAEILPGAAGPLCFQAMVTEAGEYAVFEINARFGGGYPLAHRAGARFTQWLLEEAAGLPCAAHDRWRAGVTMLRYDAAVFLE